MTPSAGFSESNPKALSKATPGLILQLGEPER